MKKRTKWILLGAVLASLAVVCSVREIDAEQRALAEQLIRLHVVANSDTQADQAVKLQVRDAVLAQLPAITGGCATKREAEEALQAALPQLQRTALSVLRENGFSDMVQVYLAQEEFPTRTYDTFSLPAGEYTALRISLGAAQGHNWWCVVFPSLCTAATAQDMDTIATASGFSEEQIRLMTDEGETYAVKFKVLEYLQEIKAWFR